MVVLYCAANGRVPFIAWFHRLPEEAKHECAGRLRLLRSHGHRLRRPVADYLRSGVYELRFRVLRVQYRVLYFFHGDVAVVVHGFQKTSPQVPEIEIRRALNRKADFEAAPKERLARHDEWLESE